MLWECDNHVFGNAALQALQNAIIYKKKKKKIQLEDNQDSKKFCCNISMISSNTDQDCAKQVLRKNMIFYPKKRKNKICPSVAWETKLTNFKIFD